jgi:quinol monooxygenase YgiN
MSVTVVVELQARPDTLEQLRSGIVGMVPDALAYDGCEGVTVYENADDATLILVEPWASRAHHERYLAWRTERGELDAVVGMLTGPPSIRYFSRVEAPTAAARG